MRILPSAVPRRISIPIVACILLLSGVIARADTAGELADAEARLRSIREEIAGRQRDLDSLQGEMNALATAVERAGTTLETTRGEIRQVTVAMRRVAERIADVRATLEARAAEAFMQGPGTDLMFLLGSTSLAELSDRASALEALGQRDADLTTRFHVIEAELTATRTRLAGLRDQQRAILVRLQTQEAELSARFEDQQTELDRMAGLREEAADLVDELGDRLDAELAEVPEPTGSGAGDGVPGPLGTCPLPGPRAYADTFGDLHAHPGWTHPHTGNDISAPYGAPIVAPFNGRAVSGEDDTAGIYVTVYGAQGFVQMLHMSRLGQLGNVRTGDVVGYIGTTGNASGPHTHFEWHPGNGAAADPYPQLNEVC